MYLLDTNVVSALRKPRPHGAVLQWVQATAEADLHLSVVTLGEIQAGIEITREQDGAKATELEQWLERVAQSYSVLPMDAATFREWARLMHRASNTLYEDAMIAAITLVWPPAMTVRSVRTHEIALADRQTVVAQDAVRGGHMKEELRQAVVRQVGLSAQFFLFRRARSQDDFAGFLALELRCVHRVQKSQGLRQQRVQIGKGLLLAVKHRHLDTAQTG